MNKRVHNSSWQTLFALSIMGEMVQIQVQGFSGPIDLLLDLIDREELDITALSLAEVTDQYWQEIEGSSAQDADALADFISVGSKLLFIKSCALLPSAKPPEADLEQEIDQTAEELTALLADHKRFRDAVDLFRQLEEEGRRTFARNAPVRNVPLPPGLEGVTLDTLLSAVKEALAEVPPEPGRSGPPHRAGHGQREDGGGEVRPPARGEAAIQAAAGRVQDADGDRGAVPGDPGDDQGRGPMGGAGDAVRGHRAD